MQAGPLSQKDVPSSLLGKIFNGTIEKIIKPGEFINNVECKTYLFQVYIIALHKGLEKSQLPYFSLLRPVFRGSTSTVGIYSLPQVGSNVAVMFDGGDEKSGYIFSEILTGVSLLPDSPEIWGWEDEHGNIFNVDSSGNIKLTASKKYSILASEDITLQVGSSTIVINSSSITLKSTNIILDGPVNAKSTVTISGNVQANSGLKVSGSSELSSAKIGGISFSSHVHGGVQTGGSSTGGPQ